MGLVYEAAVKCQGLHLASCRSWPIQGILGGSWLVISGVISPVIWATAAVILLKIRLITTHQPPSCTINHSIRTPQP